MKTELHYIVMTTYGCNAAEARKLKHDRPPTQKPNKERKKTQHHSSYIHSPTFRGLLLHFIAGTCSNGPSSSCCPEIPTPTPAIHTLSPPNPKRRASWGVLVGGDNIIRPHKHKDLSISHSDSNTQYKGHTAYQKSCYVGSSWSYIRCTTTIYYILYTIYTIYYILY